MFFVGREPRWSLAVTVEDIVQWTLMGNPPSRLLVLLTLIVTAGLGLSVAGAQTPASGYGQYYVEFRSRQAWDYGHTFVVFGRVGETPSKKNVAGLSPKGDDPKMWLMGHYMPVPSDTGWTDEAAAQLISDNLKEMSSPTRDGRAMIAAGMIHPGATLTARPASSGPSVTIGAIRVSNRPASSAEGTQNSSE